MTVGIRPIEEKVFNISTHERSGTAFTYRHNNTEYLITARHLVEKMGDNGVIDIYRMTDSIKKDVNIHYHKSKDIDIVVLSYTGFLNDCPMELIYSADKLQITQDAYFFGYPFSYCSFTDTDLKKNVYRIPLIKKGIISGANAIKDRVAIFIDAHNNQGFSGGPVVVFDYNNKPKVCGVVSGYIPYEGEIYQKGTSIVMDKISYRENSGIMLAYGINHAIEIIQQITR